MHMADEWIAVLRRGILEVYVHNGHRYMCWKTMNISHSVGTASFLETGPHGRSIHQSSTLKLCITCSSGVFLYEMVCHPREDVLSLDLIWHYSGVTTDDHTPLLTRGMLGTTGESIQWLHGSPRNRYFTVRFATARLPSRNKGGEPTIFEWHSDKMPALYSFAVYDYDDARGILVLGNAFGELSLYDFSGSDPDLFESCLATKLAINPGDRDILPVVRNSMFSILLQVC